MASPLDDDTLIARMPDMIVADLDGNAIIMDSANGHFIELNATAARLWSMIETPVTLGVLCETITRDYAVSATECREQVVQWLGEMQALKAVQFGGRPEGA